MSEYRKHKKQGGVSIMIKSHIKYMERPDVCIFDEGKFESIFIELPRKSKANIIIGEIYRVPATSELDFIDNYQVNVNKIKKMKIRKLSLAQTKI